MLQFFLISIIYVKNNFKRSKTLNKQHHRWLPEAADQFHLESILVENAPHSNNLVNIRNSNRRKLEISTAQLNRSNLEIFKYFPSQVSSMILLNQ